MASRSSSSAGCRGFDIFATRSPATQHHAASYHYLLPALPRRSADTASAAAGLLFEAPVFRVRISSIRLTLILSMLLAVFQDLRQSIF